MARDLAWVRIPVPGGKVESVLVGDLSFLEAPAVGLLPAVMREFVEMPEGSAPVPRVPHDAPIIEVIRRSVREGGGAVELVEGEHVVGTVSASRLAALERSAWANSGHTGGGSNDVPEVTGLIGGSAPPALLLFAVESLIGEAIDLFTGEHGFAHVAVDLGEHDEAGRAVVTEAVDAGVKRTYLEAYRNSQFVRVPIGEILQEHGSSGPEFAEAINSHLGEPYDYSEAVTGIDDDARRQICSGLVFEAFPPGLQRAVLAHQTGTPVSGAGAVVDPHPRVAPNDLARFLELPHADAATAPRVAVEAVESTEVVRRRALRLGDGGPDVSELHRLLRIQGFDTEGESSFGPATHLAVLDLQRELGMDRDGMVDEAVWDALDVVPDPLESVAPLRGAEIKLDVPYYSQRDNLRRPSGTCNVTCMAMVLSFHGVRPTGPGQFEDELYDLIHGPEGDAHYETSGLQQVFGKSWRNRATIHAMLVWACTRYGKPARFSQRARWDEIWGHLETTGPVVLAGKFTGAGHLVTLVGRTANGDPIVHDPWGDWSLMYRGAGVCPGAGRYAVYDFASAQQVLNKPGDRVWAHFIG